MKRLTLRLSAAILLALVCLAGTLPARAADGGELAGGAIRWQLADGTLTVSGRGAIPDFEDKSQKTMDRVPTPWYSLRGGIGRIVLEEGITAVGDHAFADLTQVRDVSLPQSLRSIGTDVFRGCAVTEVTLPAGLTELGGFRGCGKLTSINVPETVESVGVRAFEDCGSLRALSLPDGVRSVGFYAFGGTCGIETLYLPDSVVACSGGEAFFGNPTLRALRFPAGTIRVDHNAGNLCSQCTALTDIWLPETLCGLRGADFSGCTALRDVWFGGTEEQWADAGGTAFTDELADLGLTLTVHYGAADMDRPAEGGGETPMTYTVPTPRIDTAEYVDGDSGTGVLLTWRVFEEDLGGDALWEQYGYRADGFVVYRRIGDGGWRERDQTRTLLSLRLDAVNPGQLVGPQKTRGSVLRPETAYTIRFTHGESVIFEQTFQTEPHIFGFDNKCFEIGEDVFRAVLGDEEGARLYREDDGEHGRGKGGMCFGMASAVSLVNRGLLSVSCFGETRLQDVSSIYWPMTGGYGSARDLICRLQLVQLRSDVASEIEAHKGQMRGLAEAASDYEAGRAAMPLLYVSAPGYVHTLAVFGVRYDGNMPQFAVYDCNFGAPGEASLARFNLLEENGSLRWSYKGREGEADGGDTWLSWVSVTPDYLQNAACGAEASDVMMKAPGAVIPLPEGAAAWQSSDPAVAEIDPDGQAVALACGTATLTALDENGAALFSRRVSVNDGDDLAVLTSEESVISGDVLSSGALELENRTAGDLPVVILSACYGHDGRLLSVSQSRKTLRWGRSYAFPTLEALPDAAAVKYMILSGDGTMVPLIGSVDKPGPRQ